MTITPDIALLALQVVLICAAVLVTAFVGQWVIDWLDRRGVARMRTANERKMQREITGLRQRVPSTNGAPQEHWHDTMPPAARRVRAGPATDAQRQRRKACPPTIVASAPERTP